MKWTNLVTTAATVEAASVKGQWQIGDAIVKDIRENNALQNDLQMAGPSGIKNELFQDAADALAAKGIDHNGNPYSGIYVRDLFTTAFNFPRDEREQKISWEAHREAGTPENLKQAATALRKIGKTVTKYNVRDIVGHWAAELADKRRKEHAKAVAKKRKAKANKAAASADKLAAKTQADKDAAENKRLAAQQEIDEAKDAIRETGMPLPKATDYNVDTSDIGSLQQWAIFMGVTAHVAVVKREYKKSIKELEQIADLLSDSQRARIAEGWNEIVGGANTILAAVKYPGWQPEETKRPQLVAHDGGRK